MSRKCYFGADTSKHIEAEGVENTGYLAILKDPATFGYPVDKYFKAEIRFEEWVNPADRTEGLVTLGSLDITDYILRNVLKPIIEEVEDFRSENYGLIKAAQMVQEFIEELDSTTGNLGKLLSVILSENNILPDWWYTYPYGVTGMTPPPGGDPDDYRIHLWRFCIWIGDREHDIWLSTGLGREGHLVPTHDWIYGWLFDPANQTRSIFTQTRPDAQSFSLSAKSLLEWLDNFDMGEIFGDYSNKSGVYYDDSELQAGDLEYADVCDYPAIPFVKEGFAEAGVNEEDIDISTVVLTGDDADYSSLYYFRETGIGLDMQPAEGLPVIEWKNVDYVDYRVMVSDKAFPYLRVITIDRLSADTTYTRLTLTEVPTGYVIVRLWHWSGDTGYLLCKHADDDNFTDYVLVSFTLSGTSSADFAVSEVPVTLETNLAWHSHYMQMDIDHDGRRLWATRHKSGTLSADSQVDLGYYDISSSPAAWTSVQIYSKVDTGYAARIWHDDDLSNADSAAGGLRVLYSASRNYAVMFMGWLYDYAGSREWTLELYRYDDSKTTKYGGDGYDFDAYTIGGVKAYVKNFSEANHAITGGRGTIGGFYNSTDDLFVFVLPSIDLQCDTGLKVHDGVTKRWSPGAAWSITTEVLSSNSFTSFRTFNSHGTAQNGGGEDYCVGFIGTDRDTANDYKIFLKPCMVRWNSTTNALVLTVADNYFSMGDGTASFPHRKYPVLSPPSNDVSSVGSLDYVEDRSFLIQKTWGTPTQTQDLFLTTLSIEWYPQFACDFSAGSESLAEFLEEFSFAFGLVMRLSHFGVLIRQRYTSVISAQKDDLTVNSYLLNAMQFDRTIHFDNLIIKDVRGIEYKATSSQFKNALNIGERGSIFIQPHRAEKLLASLWSKHGADHRKFIVQGSWLPWLQPLDWVEIPVIVPPGDVEYESVVCEVFNLQHGLFETELTLIEVAAFGGQIT
jgi:hypothetical protein